MNPNYITLEFPHIVTMLQDLAVSQSARDELAALTPSLEEAVCLSRMEATTAARRVLDAAGSPPLAVMENLDATLQEAAQGDMLSPEQLTGAAGFAVSCRRMEAYLSGVAAQSAGIAAYRMELPDLTDLCRSIEAAVREDKLLDEASTTLRSLRRTRVRLLVPASELYPPDYDFSIIFDTVENRKAAHQMSRKFDPDAVIIHKEGKGTE